MDPRELLSEYDVHVRGSFPRRVPRGWRATADGPLTRCETGRGGFVLSSTDLSELFQADLVALVDRTTAFFAGLGRRFEWKTFDHDRPGFTDLLSSRDFVPEQHEALVLGEAADLARDVDMPAGLVLRQVRERADLDRLAAMETEVWGADWSWLADELAVTVEAPVAPTVVHVVEDGDTVVSAAWLVPMEGTRVAGLRGGSTLAAYRHRGLYRALVAARARAAITMGHSILQVDASADSRPVLERLGLQVVGGTTPYVWTPPEG